MRRDPAHGHRHSAGGRRESLVRGVLALPAEARGMTEEWLQALQAAARVLLIADAIWMAAVVWWFWGKWRRSGQ